MFMFGGKEAWLSFKMMSRKLPMCLNIFKEIGHESCLQIQQNNDKYEMKPVILSGSYKNKLLELDSLT